LSWGFNFGVLTPTYAYIFPRHTSDDIFVNPRRARFVRFSHRHSFCFFFLTFLNVFLGRYQGFDIGEDLKRAAQRTLEEGKVRFFGWRCPSLFFLLSSLLFPVPKDKSACHESSLERGMVCGSGGPCRGAPQPSALREKKKDLLHAST
jgi:hypothetical protein